MWINFDHFFTALLHSQMNYRKGWNKIWHLRTTLQKLNVQLHNYSFILARIMGTADVNIMLG